MYIKISVLECLHVDDRLPLHIVALDTMQIMQNSARFGSFERPSRLQYDYRGIITVFCQHQSALEPRLIKGLETSWYQLFLMFYQSLFMVLSLVFYVFFCRKEFYILLVKYFKMAFYGVINLYLNQIKFVAKFIIPSNQHQSCQIQ